MAKAMKKSTYTIPEGYSDDTNRVCLLFSSFYGLKQVQRCWNFRFDSWAKNRGFVSSKENPRVYIRVINFNDKIIKLISRCLLMMVLRFVCAKRQ